ncbi:hypothetical protein D9M71_348920 [compost metagenome]
MAVGQHQIEPLPGEREQRFLPVLHNGAGATEQTQLLLHQFAVDRMVFDHQDLEGWSRRDFRLRHFRYRSAFQRGLAAVQDFGGGQEGRPAQRIDAQSRDSRLHPIAKLLRNGADLDDTLRRCRIFRMIGIHEVNGVAQWIGLALMHQAHPGCRGERCEACATFRIPHIEHYRTSRQQRQVVSDAQDGTGNPQRRDGADTLLAFQRQLATHHFREPS